MGCPWNMHTCNNAAISGHLAVLQWACANGAPFNIRELQAAGQMHAPIVKWLASLPQ
jgi:hypothetical protein